MSVRNQNWYNLQSTRRYPLDDASTGEDDNGKTIKDNILVDCHIRAPRSYGAYFYVQGLHISDSLITIVVGAAETLTSTDNTTICAVSLLKPQAEFVNIPVTPMQAGVTGWIAFGSGIREPFSAAYATAKQALIAPRCGRPYDDLPIRSLGKYNLSSALSGIVNITAAAPITATYHDNYVVPKYNPETGETNSKAVKAIVFSGQAPTADFNPYSYFLSTCGQRPETGTCHKNPIETINGVSPDCETGNININFSSGLTGRMFKDCGGIDITTELGLSAACDDKPPGQEKRRDICCPNDDGESEYCWPEENQPSTTAEFQVLAQTQQLPITILFDDTPTDQKEAPTDFTTRSGNFDIKLSGYAAVDSTTVNISTYDQTASDWALDRTTSTVFYLIPDTPAVAGAVLNFSVSIVNGNAQPTYTAAVVNTFENKLQIVSYAGRAIIVEQEVALSKRVENCRVNITATALASGGATIRAVAVKPETQQVIADLTTTVSSYEIINGKSGLISLRHGAVFKEFSLQ